MSVKSPADVVLAALPGVVAGATEEGFLAGLGRRVRSFRNRRGMTRKMLAAEADVSERHLAQLEGGDGNISVLLLQRIAEALSVSIGELFADGESADRPIAAGCRRAPRATRCPRPGSRDRSPAR